MRKWSRCCEHPVPPRRHPNSMNEGAPTMNESSRSVAQVIPSRLSRALAFAYAAALAREGWTTSIRSCCSTTSSRPTGPTTRRGSRIIRTAASRR